ncbi:hypothetical protein Kpho02_28100 [Kitasatospora phosalacinea]|uniref:Uncharacterized protein n=1 Tax=Kitasatospora phosalacinea TaxID=2065 RepID=A0A9W6Q844_9ACTN|nr:hypothetical protein [Kitasatospora phosalacinea]GLW70511.1 hypothetical protein Kpho02_28100 [Kitasatospora phosalacinea]
MTARRDPAPEDPGRERPDAEGDRRYGDRAAGVRPTREPAPEARGPQEGYDATADAARRTGAPDADDADDADGPGAAAGPDPERR